MNGKQYVDTANREWPYTHQFLEACKTVPCCLLWSFWIQPNKG